MNNVEKGRSERSLWSFTGDVGSRGKPFEK